MTEKAIEGAPEILSAERCPSHHYMTGWCCQKEAGHEGPCMANAGLHGESFKVGDKWWVYAWHQPPGEPACNQTMCASPNRCECASTSPIEDQT